MMSTKTRTTIITLVATFSVAGAAMVPTVAQAKEKTKQQSHADMCQGYETEFNIIEEGAEDPKASPATKAAAHKAAAAAARRAIKAGCDTSAWRVQPETSPISVLILPGVAIQGSPEGGTPVRVTATLAVK